jgi:hypothetical protein
MAAVAEKEAQKEKLRQEKLVIQEEQRLEKKKREEKAKLELIERKRQELEELRHKRMALK